MITLTLSVKLNSLNSPSNRPLPHPKRDKLVGNSYCLALICISARPARPRRQSRGDSASATPCLLWFINIMLALAALAALSAPAAAHRVRYNAAQLRQEITNLPGVKKGHRTQLRCCNPFTRSTSALAGTTGRIQNVFGVRRYWPSRQIILLVCRVAVCHTGK